MAYSVALPQANARVHVDDGNSILDAALSCDIPYPFGCRSGMCGSCKSTLISGRVDVRGHQEFALTEEEQRQGLVLACCAYPLSDCELVWLDPDEPASFDFRECEGRVAEVRRVTHDIAVVQVALDAAAPLEFAAGQYASVSFGFLPTRHYSFANVPGSPLLEFHVRAVPGGQVSTSVYAELSPGSRVRVSGPLGAAYLRRSHTGPAIFCAGGTGLAPVLSMLRQQALDGATRPMQLFFGVRAEQDLYAIDQLNELAHALPQLEITPVLSEADGSIGRRTGFLADAVRADVGDCSSSKAYLCGPPIMVETCRRALFEKNLGPQHCHVDAFWTPPAAPA